MARKDEILEDEEDIEIEEEEEEEESSGLPRWLPIAVVSVAVLGFGGLAWMAFDSSSKKVSYSEVPVIKAEAGSIKEKPTDPGGMKVPNQDKQIFEAAAGRNEAKDTSAKVETAEETEEPIDIQKDKAAISNERQKLVEEASEGSKKVEKIASAAKETSVKNQAEELALGKAEDQLAPSASGKEKPAASPEEEAAKIASKASEKKAPAFETTPQEVATSDVVSEPSDDRGTIKTSDKLQSQAKSKDLNSKAVADAQSSSSAGGSKIQLGAFRSEQEAVGAWKKVLGSNKDLLNKRIFTIQKAEIPDKGIYYRLQVGGFKSADEASSTCKTLSTRSTNCFVVR